jgi:alkanesulfonate monooxygenase SsuD/methylene tetrahydromethanopterin reductase-like flavin-dependent oxidoreductase (luciferase family)
MEYADEWNFSLPFPPDFEPLKRLVSTSERDIRISQMGGFVIAEDREGLRPSIRALMQKRGVSGQSEKFVSDLSERGWLIGTPSEIAEQVNRVRARGVDGIYFQMWQTLDLKPITLLGEVLKSL